MDFQGAGAILPLESSSICARRSHLIRHIKLQRRTLLEFPWTARGMLFFRTQGVQHFPVGIHHTISNGQSIPRRFGRIYFPISSKGQLIPNHLIHKCGMGGITRLLSGQDIHLKFKKILPPRQIKIGNKPGPLTIGIIIQRPGNLINPRSDKHLRRLVHQGFFLPGITPIQSPFLPSS